MDQIITSEIEKSVKKSKGQKGEYLSPLNVAEFLYPQIKKFSNYSDSSEPERNNLIEYMLNLHIIDDSKYLYDWVVGAQMTMKGKKPKETIYAGDADVYLSLLVDTKKKTVFHIRNVCSCAEVVQWIVIWDKRHDCEESIHVRQIHDKSDYPKSQYPEKLGLKFYKDRKYEMEYVQKHHMTNLGGVYGDTRDRGYIASIKRYTGELSRLNRPDSAITNSLFHFYSSYTHAMFNLRWIAQEFNKNKTDKNV